MVARVLPIMCHVLPPPATGNSTICTIRKTEAKIAASGMKERGSVRFTPLQAQAKKAIANRNIRALVYGLRIPSGMCIRILSNTLCYFSITTLSVIIAGIG